VVGRFYRSDKSRHVPGSGLGLSLVSAILRLHGATLQIMANREDMKMPGSVFSVLFPAVSHNDISVTFG